MAYYQPQLYGNNFIPQQNYMSTSYQLNGKIVESEDIVRTTEIPFNGYGVYPKADMTAIFIKTWNQDGTTRITKYLPVVEPEPVEKKEEDYSSALDEIKKSILELTKKIDGFKTSSSTPMKKRREVDVDE